MSYTPNRITEVETRRLENQKGLFDAKHSGKQTMAWDVVLLRIGTEAGIDGYASALAARSGPITEAYIHEVLAPVVLGRDVTDREAIWHDYWLIDRHLTFFPVFLPGPIDVALWDIAAKSAGLPLFRYLGSFRESLPVYASSLFHEDLGEYVTEAQEYATRGIRAYKAHPPGGWQRDMEVHRLLRQEMGPDYTLMSDPVSEYTLETAIRVGRQLEELNYRWLEEPFRDFELMKYKRLSDTLDIPIAGTETTNGGPWGVAQAIGLGAVDIVRADVSWKAGVTGTIKIAHMAEAFGLQCEVHTTTMGVMELANLHVCCAIRNCEFYEMLIPEPAFRFPLAEPLPIDSDGAVHVPEEPGIGAESRIDWKLVEERTLSRRSSKL